MPCNICGRERVWHGSEHYPAPGTYLSEMGCHDGVRMDDDEHAEGWADDTIYPPCQHNPMCCKSCGGSGDKADGDCRDCNGTGWKNGEPQWPVAADDPETPSADQLRELAERHDLAVKLDESAPEFHLSNDDMKAIVFSLRFTAERL